MPLSTSVPERILHWNTIPGVPRLATEYIATLAKPVDK